jgi:hypothetical protein
VDAAHSNCLPEAERNTWQPLRRSERTAPQSGQDVASVPPSHPRTPWGWPGRERSPGVKRSPRSQPSRAHVCAEQALEDCPRDSAPQNGLCQPAPSVPVPARRSPRDSTARMICHPTQGREPRSVRGRPPPPVLLVERGACERGSPAGHGWLAEWARTESPAPNRSFRSYPLTASRSLPPRPSSTTCQRQPSPALAGRLHQRVNLSPVMRMSA